MFFEEKYMVMGRRDKTHLLTAKELHERVLKDSKSNINWIASASELVRICKRTSFPAEYALDIKCAILNCFANIEHIANCGGDRYSDKLEDKKAVTECYNSLYGIENEKAVSARKRYLTEMINRASYTRCSFAPLYHSGPTFSKIREDWIKSKVEEYISQEKIDFDKLVEKLRNEFAEIIKKAESDGVFEEDEKAERESWQEFCRMMKDIIV